MNLIHKEKISNYSDVILNKKRIVYLSIISSLNSYTSFFPFQGTILFITCSPKSCLPLL